MFVLRGLTAAGKTYENSEAIRKAVNFYLSIQNEQGGWGESLESCPSMVINLSKLMLFKLYFRKGVMLILLTNRNTCLLKATEQI
jgi:hypothetical protein